MKKNKHAKSFKDISQEKYPITKYQKWYYCYFILIFLSTKRIILHSVEIKE